MLWSSYSRKLQERSSKSQGSVTKRPEWSSTLKLRIDRVFPEDGARGMPSCAGKSGRCQREGAYTLQLTSSGGHMGGGVMTDFIERPQVTNRSILMPMNCWG